MITANAIPMPATINPPVKASVLKMTRRTPRAEGSWRVRKNMIPVATAMETAVGKDMVRNTWRGFRRSHLTVQ